jgi:DNA polymerase-3 subunit alpha
MYAAMELAGYSPSESDDLRKAISKKIKDKLHKHKEKFVRGAVQRNIEEETANAIFEDWEEFARYGFNKSHAADYGIIAVQTGYLKCHYPEEYMTALLSVTQNDTDKVALYVADCRRMGIDVRPPSVNTSGWDFTIEDLPDGRNAIRFGLGAVKNVGHGPVNAILEARNPGGTSTRGDNRPFTDINDFARRVDLRQVGKRSLECLVRVGALDHFGTRSAMLFTLDQILSISASHFRASDLGQISMFGAHTGISDEVVLPTGILEANRREILEWERELIGLYVSDHPLSPVMDALTQAVSHFSVQLSDAAPGEKVRVAGIVTRVRPHQTKTGKSMGFVTLEDLQGNIELVVFPRTWDQYWEVFEVDSVVLVDGKVDAQGGDPKVLVDSVTTDLKAIIANPPQGSNPSSSQPLPPSSALTPGSTPLAPLPTDTPLPMVEDTAAPAKTEGATSSTEVLNADVPDLGTEMPVMRSKRPNGATASSSKGEPRDESPPPPDEFPPDWNALELTPGGFILEVGSKVAEVSVSEPTSAKAEVVETTREPSVVEAVEALPTTTPGLLTTHTPSVQGTPNIPPAVGIGVTPTPLEPVVPSGVPILAAELPPAENIPSQPGMAVEPGRAVLPYILPPAEAYAGQDLHMITVILRCGPDKVRDNLRLRQCYGILISYSGNDRFALQIFERNRGYRIEFPNYTTLFSSELAGRLASIVGADNIIVESLRLH